MDVFDYECGPKCHSKQHATELNSVITQYSLPEIQAYFQLCHSAGHQTDLDGQTPLHMATACGKLDVVEWLLKEKKVDINSVDRESKWTALHKAMFYGHIEIAKFLIQNSALLSLSDNEGMQPLEIVLRDRPNSLAYSHKDSNEVFLWGENLNSTLGHSSEQRRLIPTPVDTFRRQNINIKQVLLRKYHTVFLTQCGNVYTCGHGQGGRLGLGNENTYLIPQRVESLKSEMCIQIVASINHTVIYTEKGTIYSFGLNNHQQLGQFPSPSKCLTPKLIFIKNLKGQKIKGVCVSQYHSVFYTQDALFAVGFNGGQLGFPKTERYQVQLRPAPLLEQIIHANKEKRLLIDKVACSDAATVCLTTSGDIFVLHEYQCRKITSSWPTVFKIEVIGGNLDLSSEVCSSPTSSADKSSSFTTGGGTQLVIMVLSSNGMVYIWRSLNPVLRCCVFNIRNLYVADICLSDLNFGFVTIDGRAFTGSWKNIKKVIKEKVVTKDEENPFIHPSKRKTVEKEEIEVCRIPYIHRASSISMNREGNNFAVTQVSPLKSIDLSYHVKTSNMTVDFKGLMDSHWYDLQIKFGHLIWPAHRYIVAVHSNFYRKILFESSENKTNSDLIISVGYIHIDLVKQLFQFFYTDTCDLTTPGTNFVWTTEQKQYIDYDYFTDPLSSDNCSPFTTEFSHFDCYDKHSKENDTFCNDPISLLLLIANKFEIERLSNRLKKVKFRHGVVNLNCCHLDVPRLRFDRLKLPELSDITIKSEDGSTFKGHRCVLVARSEYFCCMLTNDWLESSKSEALKLPFSAAALNILLDYLYTNEVDSLFVNKTVDLLYEVLVMANQLLLTGLKDIAEEGMTSLINLKNVGEILEFSYLYNANHLKETCMKIICHNMAFMLESRFLDGVSDDIIIELTKFYRKMIDRMSRRLVTPFSSGPDETYLKSLVIYLRNNKQTNLKSDSGSKQKFSKRRPRVKTKSVSEEDVIEHNKSPQVDDVVDEANNNVFIAEDVPEKEKDESTPQKINRLQKVKRDKNNPWNILTSPVKAEDSIESKSPENSFLAGKIVNLADIMAEQNSLSRPTDNQQQSFLRYKKPRKSVPKSPPVSESKSIQSSPNNPWLKQNMNDPVSENKNVQSSPNNPWLKQNINQENICPKPNFSDIVQDELQKVKNSVRIQKKPLKYIQIEEKAIEELLTYYSTDCSFEENITINRETLTREQPIWGRKKNLLFQS